MPPKKEKNNEPTITDEQSATVQPEVSISEKEILETSGKKQTVEELKKEVSGALQKLKVAKVPCGQSVVQDHEKRLSILEQQIIPEIMQKLENIVPAVS